jgi:hypothetical protein
LDTGLVEYFKAQAGERGYQTLINETLRQAMEHDELEERLRRIIRADLNNRIIRRDPDFLPHDACYVLARPTPRDGRRVTQQRETSQWDAVGLN